MRPTFEAAQDIYDSLGVELSFSWDPSSTWDEEPTTTNDLVDHGSEHYGGIVPAGTDVVYTASDNVDGTVAGTAMCIGGGLHEDTAFAAGNLYREREAPTLPGVFSFAPNIATITFAHEVAHLFGAQHHFANCTESVPSYPGPDDILAVCTVMINDNGVAQLSWSTVNAAVTRGYLEELKG